MKQRKKQIQNIKNQQLSDTILQVIKKNLDFSQKIRSKPEFMHEE